MSLVLVLSLALAPSAPPAGEDAYRRAVREAVRRAQQRLVDGLDLGADHSSWEDPWVVTSESYEVRTTHSHYLAADLGRGLDVMLGHYRELLGSDHVPARPLRVFVLPDLAAYNTFGEDHGAEHSSFYGSFFPEAHPENPVAVLYDENPTLLRMWTTHSALHQFLRDAYPNARPPAWVSEGLASYFALFWDASYGEREIRRLVAGYEPPSEEPESLLGRLLDGGGGRAPAGEYVPLPELLPAPIASYTDRSHARLIELGMLFTYLLAYRDDTRTVVGDDGVVQAPFARYLRAVLEGGDLASMPVHALLNDRAAELDADFRAYFSS